MFWAMTMKKQAKYVWDGHLDPFCLKLHRSFPYTMSTCQGAVFYCALT